jgi:uncharacterized protein YoaH (UPF0181 family)
MSGIVLGGVTLSAGMYWAERYTSQSVAQAVERTLGGVPVIFENGLSKGEAITLVAGEMNGMLRGVIRRSVVDQIIALAAVVGAQYTLNFNDVAIAVIFRHSDPPAVDMQPLIPHTADSPTDLMRGSIKLLTI